MFYQYPSLPTRKREDKRHGFRALICCCRPTNLFYGMLKSRRLVTFSHKRQELLTYTVREEKGDGLTDAPPSIYFSSSRQAQLNPPFFLTSIFPTSGNNRITGK